MLDNLSPQSNSTSALLEFWIWSDCSHGYWSFAEKTFVKQSMMLCAFEILLKIGWVGGGKSYRWFGVNRTWRFEGKSSVWFTPPNHQVRFGHMGLFIWHLVSRVFWVKFLFLSQHLKREVGFFNFTTLLLIIYSLLQYNIHLCEICCCKCSKVAWTFY